MTNEAANRDAPCVFDLEDVLEAYRNLLNILAMGMLISIVLNVVLCAWVFRLVFF